MNVKTIGKDIMMYLLKIVLIICVLTIIFAIGLIVGYSVVGDGAHMFDVFKHQTWQHIINFVG